MTERHKVVCIKRVGPANPRDTPHVMAIGTTGGDGNIDRFWSAEEVEAATGAGHMFFTRRPTSRSDGSVFAFRCKLCGREALRSGPDTEEYNRLEQHPPAR